ncbi:MAG: hypothetical protein JOZ18_06260, partial [Chloroflexi bacterium]|nr:hypothetical protein [Chloroflexota bacterium]
MQKKYRFAQTIELGKETLREEREERQEDILTNILAPARASIKQRATYQETTVQICISLLGEMQVWLEMNGEKVEFPLKSHRRQELLAYIATMAPERSKRISSGRILTDVFEHIAPGADVANLRLLFQKHTQLLRKE